MFIRILTAKHTRQEPNASHNKTAPTRLKSVWPNITLMATITTTKSTRPPISILLLFWGRCQVKNSTRLIGASDRHFQDHGVAGAEGTRRRQPSPKRLDRTLKTALGYLCAARLGQAKSPGQLALGHRATRSIAKPVAILGAEGGVRVNELS